MANLVENQQLELFEELRQRPHPESLPPSSSRLVRDGLALLVHSGTRFWTAYDAGVAVLSAYLGFRLSPAYSFASASGHPDPALVPLLCGILFVLASLVSGVYERRCFESRVSALLRIGFATATTWCVLLIGYYVLRYEAVGRWIVGIAVLSNIVSASLPRILLHRAAVRSPRRVLVAGTRKAIRTMQSFIGKPRGNGFQVVGLVQLPNHAEAKPLVSSQDWRRDYSLPEACLELDADVVVVGDDAERNHWGLQQEIMQCIEQGVQVTDMGLFIEENFQKVPVFSVGPEWLLSANLHVSRPFVAWIKRGSDILFALVGLALTLPLWPIIALLIKLTSRGPVFYRQLRVGRFGQSFSILKFRTMRTDAEAEGKALWARVKDPRVTFVGRMLRKTRLDEIPQFWSILKGDMSFIGPRPERQEFVESLARKMPQYRWRHLVRPGATGWAQINFRYGASEEDAWEKLSYDLYYIKHSSLALDAYITLRTIGALFRGAR